MLEHRTQTSDHFITLGVSKNQTWLRELVLIISLTKRDREEGDIDFTPIELCDSKGGRCWLDPVATERFQLSKNEWKYYVYFNHDMKVVCDELGGNEHFDVRAFLFTKTALHYELERTDRQLASNLTEINQAWLSHRLDSLLIPVEMTLESE